MRLEKRRSEWKLVWTVLPQAQEACYELIPFGCNKGTLGARDFSCAVSGVGNRSEEFPSATREKKPLVPRVQERMN